MAVELRERRSAGSGSWLNDTVVILLLPCPWRQRCCVRPIRRPPSGNCCYRMRPSGCAPNYARARRPVFDRRVGRPSVPIETLLRLLYLKHRYGLGYESLCREVADSISWRRFCRIPLDRPGPHPTTLVKLVRRAGPETVAQLNAALLEKLAGDKLLRGRKLRVDTTLVEAAVDHPNAPA